MKLLLDTHAYLWLRLDSRKLPATVLGALRSNENELFVSVVSLWEMTIKSSKGHLTLPGQSVAAVYEDLARFSIHVIGIEVQDLSYLATLPQIHKDPFDRLLVSQAATRDLTLLTTDGALEAYDVSILWK